MEELLKIFEQVIVNVLIVLMMVVIAIATLVFCFTLIQYIFTSKTLFTDASQLMNALGDILLVLIGIELLDTIKAYLSEHVIHVEVVLEVALIAVARKVIILDYKEYSPLTIFAISAIILALSIGYFLEKRSRNYKSQLEIPKPPDTVNESSTSLR